MKRILCFGDSNIWGYIPVSGKRYNKETRWSGILSALLKDKYILTEAGCCNRTAFSDNPSGTELTGYKILPKYIDSSIDIVILAAGINDTQIIYNNTPKDFEEGITKLVYIIRNTSPSAEIIITVPPVINENIKKTDFKYLFDSSSEEKAKKLSEIYKNTADNLQSNFFDFNDFVEVSPLDGLHLSAEAHKKIAYKLYDYITENFDN